MNPVRIVAAVAVAAALALTGCAGATADQPTPAPVQTAAPTPKPVPKAHSYYSADELREAVDAAGVPCQRWLLDDINLDDDGTQVSLTIECNDSQPAVTMTFYDDPATLKQDLHTWTNGAGWDAPSLIGPNWTVDPLDRDKVLLLQSQLGGTPLWEMGPER